MWNSYSRYECTNAVPFHYYSITTCVTKMNSTVVLLLVLPLRLLRLYCCYSKYTATTTSSTTAVLRVYFTALLPYKLLRVPRFCLFSLCARSMYCKCKASTYVHTYICLLCLSYVEPAAGIKQSRQSLSSNQYSSG